MSSKSRGSTDGFEGPHNGPRDGRTWLRHARSVLSVGLVTSVALATAVGADAASRTPTVGHQASATGDTLTIAESQYPSSLDPASGQNAYGDYFDLAYAPLIVKESNGQYAPGLATSWKYGKDNRSFTITLRSGVEFSDGTPLNASAVQQWIKHETAFSGGNGAGYFKALTSVQVQGPLKLTLHFSAPTPNLELTLSQVLEMGEIGSPAGISGNTLTTATDGAGEYMLDPTETITGETYTYVPNPHYWDKSAVHWNKVVISVIANPSSALSALEAGQVDVAQVQPITNAKAATAAGLKVDAPLTLYMAMALADRNSKPLNNLLVRQALNYAVNRNAIAKLLGNGYGLATDEMAVPGDDSYVPGLKNYYAYNPAKAKRLLGKAGYPHGFTLPVLSLEAAQQNTLAEALQGQLAKVGVKLKPSISATVNTYETDIADEVPGGDAELGPAAGGDAVPVAVGAGWPVVATVQVDEPAAQPDLPAADHGVTGEGDGRRAEDAEVPGAAGVVPTGRRDAAGRVLSVRHRRRAGHGRPPNRLRRRVPAGGLSRI